MTMEAVVKLDCVEKQFGRVVALENLNLSISAGDTYFFLGPNGSGKTTLLRLITGGLRPTHGKVQVMGVDPYHHPDVLAARLGVAFEDHYVSPWATAFSYLQFAGRARGLEEDLVAQAADVFELRPYWGRPVETYSAGMRKRVVLAQAWMGNPPLLILDEPFSNLDPEGRRLLSDLLTQRAKDGLTTLVASHLAEVGTTPTHLALLLDGHLEAVGRLKDLGDRYAARAVQLSVHDTTRAVKTLLAAGVAPVTADEGRVTVHGDSEAIEKALSALRSAGIQTQSGKEVYDLWAIYGTVLPGRVERPASEPDLQKP